MTDHDARAALQLAQGLDLNEYELQIADCAYCTGSGVYDDPAFSEPQPCSHCSDKRLLLRELRAAREQIAALTAERDGLKIATEGHALNEKEWRALYKGQLEKSNDLAKESYTLREALRGLVDFLKPRTKHYECEDCWYSCPKTEDYCGERTLGYCNCGADEMAKQIARAEEVLNA